MATQRHPETSWRVAGASVRGSLHVRDGRPNQDAIAFSSKNGLALIAVADGHGGARHFRSETGSRFAVEQACRVLAELAPRLAAAPSSDRAELATTKAPQQIVDAWTVAVRAHLAARPIDDDEWQKLAAAEGDEAAADVAADPLLAYGATLLAVLAFRQGMLLLQIGDGDILAVTEGGAVSRPLPADERLIGNLTTSLCRPDAAADFRALLLPKAPALLLLSTDGYANSYRTDEDFLQVGRDYLEMIRTQSWPAVAGQLPGFLERTTEDGSGDDISLGLLRPDDGSGPLAEPAADPGELARVREQLAGVQSRHERLRKIALLIVIAALAGFGWSQRESLAAMFADKPETAGTGSAAQGVLPKTAGKSSGKTAAPPEAVAELPDLPVNIPVTSPKTGRNTLSADSKRLISDVSARAGAKFITVSARLNRPTGAAEACEIEALIWSAKGEKLKAVTVKLAAIDSAVIDETTTVPIPFPLDEKSARAMRDPASRASMRLVCGGHEIEQTGRLKIDR